MTNAVASLNAFVTRLFDVLLLPFVNRPPLAALAVFALIVAIAMLIVVRATSDQAAITAIKRSLYACVLEIRLFNDSAPAMWRAVGEMARHNLAYLRRLAVPMLCMIVPLFVLFTQLQFRFGYGGLEVGRPVIVKARFGPQVVTDAPVLTAPRGIAIETPAVWIPSLREAAWRIAAQQPGDYELMLQVNGQTYTKTVRVSQSLISRSPLRTDDRFLGQFLRPVESPLPASAGVESIAVTYPRRDLRVFGWSVSWVVVLVVLSFVFATALKRPFRVVF